MKKVIAWIALSASLAACGPSLRMNLPKHASAGGSVDQSNADTAAQSRAEPANSMPAPEASSESPKDERARLNLLSYADKIEKNDGESDALEELKGTPGTFLLSSLRYDTTVKGSDENPKPNEVAYLHTLRTPGTMRTNDPLALSESLKRGYYVDFYLAAPVRLEAKASDVQFSRQVCYEAHLRRDWSSRSAEFDGCMNIDGVPDYFSVFTDGHQTVSKSGSTRVYSMMLGQTTVVGYARTENAKLILSLYVEKNGDTSWITLTFKKKKKAG